MSIEREKYQLDSGDVLYNEQVVAVKALPTLVTQGVEINASTVKGPRYLAIGGKLSGGSAAAMRLWPCFWDPRRAKWFMASSLLMSTDANIAADTTDTLGNVYQVVKPSWATRFYPCLPAGPAAANILDLIVTEDT